MADASYILVSPDFADLPNSRTLRAGTGITLQDSGAGNNLTIQPLGNLLRLFNFNSNGFLSYNNGTQTFSGRSFSGGSTISITNPDGTVGNPVFGVIPDSSIQRIQVQQSGVGISTRSRLNFIEGTGVSISVSDDFPNNRASVTISAT